MFIIRNSSSEINYSIPMELFTHTKNKRKRPELVSVVEQRRATHTKNKRKRPELVSVVEQRRTKRNYQLQLEEEKRLKKKSDVEELAKMKEHEEWLFAGKMRRMEKLQERRGKDWCLSREETYDVFGTNIAMLDEWGEKHSEIQRDYIDKKISEEEFETALEKNHQEYDAKEKEWLDVEDAKWEQIRQAKLAQGCQNSSGTSRG